MQNIILQVSGRYLVLVSCPVPHGHAQHVLQKVNTAPPTKTFGAVSVQPEEMKLEALLQMAAP